MITHVVMFKLENRAPEKVAETKAILLAMQGQIPQLRYLEVGMDELHSERSYELVLISRFDSWEDLNAYRVHPVHQKVLAHINAVAAATVAVDYPG